MEIALNPTICVRYKAKSSQFLLKLLLLSSPFWAICTPLVVVWSVVAVGNAGDIPFLCCVFGFTLLCAAALFVCSQSTFEISAKGIKFPVRCAFELGGQLYREWDQLDFVRFIDADVSHDRVSNYPSLMSLRFKDGRKLPLDLRAFSKEDLQTFVLALQCYVPELPISPPLSETHLGISVASVAQKASSFTQIWEDDMASRFGSTVFVPLEPGNSLKNKKLEILGQMAFGGLSAIYLAKSTDGVLCAIKEAVVPASADASSKEKAMEMFEREAKFLMTLSHPRIASVIDHFVENGRHYLQLEYIEGKDLRHYVREKGEQPESVVLRWLIEIAQVLEYLHNLNPPIIHRDLTPDNLVLEADGSIALIDFGAANQFLGTATGTLVGKQSYISPEQFRGKASPASDFYSLGATAFFLLTGKDPEALSTSHVKEVDSFLSAEINTLVAELTAVNAAERIGSAEELINRCRQIQALKAQEIHAGN